MKRVFISYCREDGDFADNLRRRLEEAEIPTWQDTDLYGGQPWRAEIDLAIREALAVVVIVSPEAMGSAYVNYEWAFALGVGVNVVPILLRAAPEELHPALASRNAIDFSNRLARPWDLLFRAIQGARSALAPTTLHVPAGAPPVLEQAVRALDSLDVQQRGAAFDTLKAMAHPAVAEVLAEAVRHPVKDVRYRAGRLLLRLRDKRALPALFEEARTERDHVKSSELADLGPAASPELIEALRDPDRDVRSMAACALGEIGDRAAIPHLTPLLQDPDGGVCGGAQYALRLFGDEALLPVFQEAFRRDADPEWALRAAADLPDNAGESLLIEGLAHDDSSVRAAAADLLANRATGAAFPALLRVVKDSDSRVRQSALKAVARFPNENVIAAVLEALEDGGGGVRSAAGEAAEKIGGPAVVSGLLRIVRDPDKIYRADAANLLGKLADESAVPVLIEALQDPDTLVPAVSSLGQLAKPGSPAVPALAALASHEHDRVRWAAASALAKIADPASVAALAGLLDDKRDDIRRTALTGLRRIITAGTPDAQRRAKAILRERQAMD